MARPSATRLVVKPAHVYRHGSLRSALIVAAEALIERDGTDAFSLRECARSAGVSHAAPAHHFRDVGDLLTAVAATGFERLTAAMARARSTTGAGLADSVEAIGAAYVTTAIAHPAMFRLMFHSGRVDRTAPQFRAAAGAAYAVLADILAAAMAPRKPTKADLRFAWAAVHGFATLTIEGRFGADAGSAAARTALGRSVATGLGLRGKRLSR